MRTLLDPNATNDTQAPKNPATVFVQPKAKLKTVPAHTANGTDFPAQTFPGYFRTLFKPKAGEAQEKPKDSLTFTVLANYYAIQEKGMKNPVRIFSNYFTDWTDPLEVTAVDRATDKVTKIIRFEEGKSYTTAKEEIKAATGQLTLYVIGFINAGHIVQLELTGTNLYYWNRHKRENGIDFAETPVVQLTYKDPIIVPNEYNKDEPLHIYHMAAKPMSDDERQALESIDTNELREYLAYRRMTDRLAQLASSEENAAQDYPENNGDEAQPEDDKNDLPPNFPEAPEMPEAAEDVDDMPF